MCMGGDLCVQLLLLKRTEQQLDLTFRPLLLRRVNWTRKGGEKLIVGFVIVLEM